VVKANEDIEETIIFNLREKKNVKLKIRLMTNAKAVAWPLHMINLPSWKK
jgi:hypothetical protein